MSAVLCCHSSRHFHVSAPSSRRGRAAAKTSGAISRAFTPMRSAGWSTAAQWVTQPQFWQWWNSMDLSPHRYPSVPPSVATIRTCAGAKEAHNTP
jgi:hypothetical protein